MKRVGVWSWSLGWAAAAVAVACAPQGREIEREESEHSAIDAGPKVRSEPTRDARSASPEDVDRPQRKRDQEPDTGIASPQAPLREGLDAAVSVMPEAGTAPSPTSDRGLDGQAFHGSEEGQSRRHRCDRIDAVDRGADDRASESTCACDQLRP